MFHPKTPVRDPTPQRRQDLHDALHAAVNESIRYGRVPYGERWLTRVRDERDPKCPRCATPLQRGTVAGRTAVWCSREQR